MIPAFHTERAQALPYAAGDDYLALLDLIAIDKELVSQGGLREFVPMAWPVLQPGVPLVWGWHMDAVTDFVWAWIQGGFKDGVINVPPRTAKSTVASVCAPVCGWIEMPWLQFLTISYRDDLSTRDSVRSRRLIQSLWFQDRWGDRFQLAGDHNQKTRYENDKGGYRLSQSVAGGSTGEGGNRIINDDPHNVRRAESDVERQNCITHWDEEMTSRLNDQRTDGMLVIMQRLHEQDLSGHILAKETGALHLCLPMEFEPDRKCVIDKAGFQFEDPRSESGDMLDPERFPMDVVERMAVKMGPYAAAGQLQQRPAPREGAMMKVDLIQRIMAPPAEMSMVVRYWDKAGTSALKAKGRGAHTSGALVGRVAKGAHKGKFIIMDMVRGQWEAGPREMIIKNTAIKDGRLPEIHVEQEPGSGGKESAQNTIKNLAGWKVYADRPTGDKTLRAEPLAAQMEGGNILMLEGKWNDQLEHELRMFPAGAQKDQVDSVAGALNKLAEMSGGGYTW